jgi:hypothetical protein
LARTWPSVRIVVVSSEPPALAHEDATRLVDQIPRLSVEAALHRRSLATGGVLDDRLMRPRHRPTTALQ